MSSLLDALTPDQQKLSDLIAEAFALDGEWPVFDYLQGTFDREDKDATETLASFPRVGRWGYGAVWWVAQGQAPGVTPGQQVALTVVGIHHTRTLQPFVDLYFDLIEMMVFRRRSTLLERRKPRELVITDEDRNRSLVLLGRSRNRREGLGGVIPGIAV